MSRPARGFRGWRRRFYASAVPPIKQPEITGLKSQAEWLKEQLNALQKRFEELTA